MRITKCGRAKKIACYREHHAVSQSGGGIQLGLFGHIVEWTTAEKNVMTEMMEVRKKKKTVQEVDRRQTGARPTYTVQHRSPKTDEHGQIWWQVQ